MQTTHKYALYTKNQAFTQIARGGRHCARVKTRHCMQLKKKIKINQVSLNINVIRTYPCIYCVTKYHSWNRTVAGHVILASRARLSYSLVSIFKLGDLRDRKNGTAVLLASRSRRLSRCGRPIPSQGVDFQPLSEVSSDVSSRILM